MAVASAAIGIRGQRSYRSAYFDRVEGRADGLARACPGRHSDLRAGFATGWGILHLEWSAARIPLPGAGS